MELMFFTISVKKNDAYIASFKQFPIGMTLINSPKSNIVLFLLTILYIQNNCKVKSVFNFHICDETSACVEK